MASKISSKICNKKRPFFPPSTFDGEEYRFQQYDNGDIFMRKTSIDDQFKKFSTTIKEYFAEHVPDVVDPGKICYPVDILVTQLTDGTYARIRPLKLEKDKLQCHAFDFGFTAKFPLTRVFKLPSQFSKTPTFTEKFRLHNFKITAETKVLNDWFKERLKNKIVLLEKFYSKKQNVTYVKILDGSSDLAKEMEIKAFGQIKRDNLLNEAASLINRKTGGTGYKKPTVPPVKPTPWALGAFPQQKMPAFNNNLNGHMFGDEISRQKSGFGKNNIPYHGFGYNYNGIQEYKNGRYHGFGYNDVQEYKKGGYKNFEYNDSREYKNEGYQDFEYDSQEFKNDEYQDFGYNDAQKYMNGGYQDFRPKGNGSQQGYGIPAFGSYPPDFSRLNSHDGNNNRSFSAIPPPPSNSSTTMDTKDREVSNLRGQLKAYEVRLMNEKLNFARQPKARLHLLKELVEKRAVVQPYVNKKACLVAALDVLFKDDKFHCHFDNVLHHISQLKPKLKKDLGYQEEKIQTYKHLVYDLKVDELSRKYRALIKELSEDLEKVRAIKFEVGELERRKFGDDEYTVFGHDFLSWRTSYLDSQKKTDNAAEKLKRTLSAAAKFVEKIYENEDANFEQENIQSLIEVFEAESGFAKQFSFVSPTIESVLAELHNRVFKIATVEEFSAELLKYQRRSIEADTKSEGNTAAASSPENQCTGNISNEVSSTKALLRVNASVPESNFPTLRSFIGRTQSMNGEAKKIIVKDVYDALFKLHIKKQRYCYLSPENILLKFDESGDAILCPLERACLIEPSLPSTFFAPEISAGDLGQDGVQSSPRSPIGGYSAKELSVDSYSFGKLIIWLALIGSKGEYYEIIPELLAQNPMLKKMIMPDANYRISLVDIDSCLDKLLNSVFGVTETTPPCIGGETLTSTSHKSSKLGHREIYYPPVSALSRDPFDNVYQLENGLPCNNLTTQDYCGGNSTKNLQFFKKSDTAITIQDDISSTTSRNKPSNKVEEMYYKMFEMNMTDSSDKSEKNSVENRKISQIEKDFENIDKIYEGPSVTNKLRGLDKKLEIEMQIMKEMTQDSSSEYDE